jgi:hypothetical protein
MDPFNRNNNFTNYDDRNKRNRQLLVIGLAIFFLIFGYAVIYNLVLKPKSADQIATTFISDVYVKNNASAAYKLTSPDFRNATSNDEWSNNVSNAFNLCSGSIKKTSSKLNNLDSTVSFSIKTKYGTCSSTVTLVKKLNKWYVDFYTPY